MKKSLLLIAILSIGLNAMAKDFKVGDAKYEILSDNSVSLKDYSKATGVIEIPETVTDPKTKTEYNVTKLGVSAFAKSAITGVVIPKSIKTIAPCVFEKCKELTAVTWNTDVTIIPAGTFDKCVKLENFDFTPIGKIESNAFSHTGLKAITITNGVVEICSNAFLGCSDLKAVYFVNAPYGINQPLIINEAVFYGDPIETILIDRDIKYVENYSGVIAQNKPFNNNPALKYLWIGENASVFPKNLVENCTGLEGIVIMDELAGEKNMNLLKVLMDPRSVDYHRIDMDYLTAEEGIGPRNLPDYSFYKKIPEYKFYLGAETTEDGQFKVKNDAPVSTMQAFSQIFYNNKREEMSELMGQMVEYAANTPSRLSLIYQRIRPKDAIKYNDIILPTIKFICDSLYLVKPTLDQKEVSALRGFINNLLMGIGADYGYSNMSVETWAKADILAKDLESGKHKEDYERILKVIDRLYTFVDKKSNPYHQTMQMAALCGLGRWKEASNYFRTVCNAVTENGTYYQEELPYEITYMQKAIQDHGYKAVVPKYTKASAKSDNGSTIQLFMDAAINLGVEHYKKKKAEKEFRELYYESIGLDKKGRPKKR